MPKRNIHIDGSQPRGVTQAPHARGAKKARTVAKGAVAAMRQDADEVAASLHHHFGSNAALAIGRSSAVGSSCPAGSVTDYPASSPWSPEASSTVFVLPNMAVPGVEPAVPLASETSRLPEVADRVSLNRKSKASSTDSSRLQPAVYARELLKIQVSAAAVLADKRLPVGRVVHIAPGTILKFGKSCDQPIELEVGGRRIATGEAVTIGERFGLRITSLNKKMVQDG